MRLFYSKAGSEWECNKYIDIVFRGYLVAVAPISSSSRGSRLSCLGILVMACHWKPLWWMTMLDWKRRVIYIRLIFYFSACSLLVGLPLSASFSRCGGEILKCERISEQRQSIKKMCWEMIFSQQNTLTEIEMWTFTPEKYCALIATVSASWWEYSRIPCPQTSSH